MSGLPLLLDYFEKLNISRRLDRDQRIDKQISFFFEQTCIIIGCGCITATTILLAISQRNVTIAHYARWTGFTAMVRRFCNFIPVIEFLVTFWLASMKFEHLNLLVTGPVLFCRSHFPNWFRNRSNWRRSLPASIISSSRSLIYTFHSRPVDNRDF